jgi:hypothetical protein
MRKVFRGVICMVAAGWLVGCVVSTSVFDFKPAVTGLITGIVVDAKQRPVSGAFVDGVYARKWTTIMPPVPDEFVVGTATTDVNGRFAFNTSKRVDILMAQTPDFGLLGELDIVTQKDNVIQLRKSAARLSRGPE